MQQCMDRTNENEESKNSNNQQNTGSCHVIYMDSLPNYKDTLNYCYSLLTKPQYEKKSRKEWEKYVNELIKGYIYCDYSRLT